MAMSPLITTGPFVGNPRGYFHSMLADPAQHFKTRSDRGQGRSPSRKYTRQRVPGWHAFGNEVDRFIFEVRDA